MSRLRRFLAAEDLQPLQIPTGVRILVLSPHQDDETIGCGGAISLLSENGCSVDVVFLTDGSRSDPTRDVDSLVEDRKREAREACAILGVNECRFLDRTDGQLLEDGGAAAELSRSVDVKAYSVILCPWPYEKHGDHKAACIILMEALKNAGHDAELWLYEVWSPLLPNRVLDISAAAERKRQALLCYKSQLVYIDYVSAAVGLGKYRSINIPGATDVEAYIVERFSQLKRLRL